MRRNAAGVLLKTAPPPVPARRSLNPGTILARDHTTASFTGSWSCRQASHGTDKTYRSLSEGALAITGTKWNGPRFLWLEGRLESNSRAAGQARSSRMKKPPPKTQRCAIYTRVSTEHGPEQEFNSLDNQREAKPTSEPTSRGLAVLFGQTRRRRLLGGPGAAKLLAAGCRRMSSRTRLASGCRKGSKPMVAA
jgi:hypothetical protein